jgi:hypothetical protein
MGDEMTEPMPQPLDRLAQALNRAPIIAPEVLMPGLVLSVLWPILRVVYDSEVDAFLLAFMVTVALRLAIKAEMLILTAQSRLGRRVTVLATLIFGPGLLAMLILHGDPSWCQRFLSAYFLVMAALFFLDVLDGKGHLASQAWPEVQRPCARRVLAQLMVIFHLGMLLANESMITNSGFGNWLVFLGYAPLISHLVVQSLLAVLNDMAARGKGVC